MSVTEHLPLTAEHQAARRIAKLPVLEEVRHVSFAKTYMIDESSAAAWREQGLIA